VLSLHVVNQCACFISSGFHALFYSLSIACSIWFCDRVLIYNSLDCELAFKWIWGCLSCFLVNKIPHLYIRVLFLICYSLVIVWCIYVEAVSRMVSFRKTLTNFGLRKKNNRFLCERFR